MGIRRSPQSRGEQTRLHWGSWCSCEAQSLCHEPGCVTFLAWSSCVTAPHSSKIVSLGAGNWKQQLTLKPKRAPHSHNILRLVTVSDSFEELQIGPLEICKEPGTFMPLHIRHGASMQVPRRAEGASNLAPGDTPVEAVGQLHVSGTRVCIQRAPRPGPDHLYVCANEDGARIVEWFQLSFSGAAHVFLQALRGAHAGAGDEGRGRVPCPDAGSARAVSHLIPASGRCQPTSGSQCLLLLAGSALLDTPGRAVGRPGLWSCFLIQKQTGHFAGAPSVQGR